MTPGPGLSIRSGLQFTLVILSVVALAASFIRPLYLSDQLLQNVPSVMAIIALAIAARRRMLCDFSSLCIIWFLWLHILGGRYVYSLVPYDDWSEAILGSRISDWFGWQRNHYDRMIHLLFGLFMVAPAKELTQKWCGVTRGWSYVIAFAMITSVGACYEIFEWLLAMTLAPDRAEAYNGQQGDMWDAQKDMALASGGASFAIAVGVIIERKRSRSVQR